MRSVLAASAGELQSLCQIQPHTAPQRKGADDAIRRIGRPKKQLRNYATLRQFKVRFNESRKRNSISIRQFCASL
jgi:hypothetical protein